MGTRTTAKERLRERLAKQGKAAPSQAEASCPLQPPTDPHVLLSLQEAQQEWVAGDQKRATVLYKLAARKGYVPALVLLISKAEAIKDSALVIDSLFSLLLHPQARLQIPYDTLKNSSAHLALLLKQPMHQDVIRQRRGDLDKLGRSWPILSESLQSVDPKDVMGQIQELLKRAPESAPDPVEEGASALAALTERIVAADGGARKKGAESFASCMDLAAERNRGLADEILGMQRQAQAAKDVASSMDGGRSGSEVLDALRAVGQISARGAWERSEGGWRFRANLPALESLSDGFLDITQDEIKLTIGDGKVVIQEPIPNGTLYREAKTTWSGKRKLLTVFFPLPQQASPPSPLRVSLRAAESQDLGAEPLERDAAGMALSWEEELD